MKKILSVFVAMALLLGLCACNGAGSPITKKAYKIAVITGSLSSDKESFEQAKALKETYEDRLITATFPDDPDQIIPTILGITADPEVKVLILSKAIHGTAAAVRRMRETRNDILVITGVTPETVTEVAPVSDICLLANTVQTGSSIITQSVDMGAETFVHITCEQDLSYSAAMTHQDLLKESCALNGIQFIELIGPDPTASGGVIGTQNWINETVPKLVEEYGPNTAFYATNCAMTVPLIKQVAELGAILPQQCHPSPYHGFPEAFDIDLQGHETDIEYLFRRISDKLHEYGTGARMATWTTSDSMLFIKIGVEYGLKWCEGRITDRADRPAMMNEIWWIAGRDAVITNYTDDTLGWLKDSFVYLGPYRTLE